MLGINKNKPDLTKPINKVYARIIDTNSPTDTICTDIGGKYPIVSTRGHCYIFVMYVYNCNKIILESMRTRARVDISSTFMTLLNKTTARGFQPILSILDNEVCQNSVEH